MRTFAVLTCSLAATARGQARIPIRTIGPILATSTENVGPAVSVRGTSDGHVIVAAGGRKRVYAFDSTLKSFTLVVDSGSGTGTVAVRATGLIPYLGDSTLLPDVGANALHVLDATGKQVRSMAPPRPRDLGDLAVPAALGRPGFDPKGRLVYRVNIPPAKRLVIGQLSAMSGDSAAIVRGDFETRGVDTLGWVNAPTEGKFAQEFRPNPNGGPAVETLHFVLNPFNTPDGWALLSDGTIAILRVHDYHIDWVDPDGTKRSSPKMPIDWRKYTDAERTQHADSVRRTVEELVKPSIAARGGTARLDVGFVPDSEFPEFWPPAEPGALLADLDAHLWILPMTSTNAANGFTYDVVNRQGEVVERVQLPKDHVLVGFGPHNIIYLTKVAGPNTYLVRALLRAPAK